MKSYDTLSEAVTSLQERGYQYDFSLAADRLECAPLNIALHPEDFHVDEVHRFEGMSSTDDNSVVYAITSRDGVKGTLVDAYGVYAEHISDAIRRKLR